MNALPIGIKSSESGRLQETRQLSDADLGALDAERIFVLPVKFASSIASLGMTLAIAAGASTSVRAADFQNVVVSAAEDGTAQATFPTDTPEIFVRANMVDIAEGSVVTITWLAVDTGPENPPNYRLNQVSLPVGRVGRLLRTSVVKPGERWQPGSYRVRLSVNQQTLKRVDFVIQ